jgi:hypothetical protein
VRDGLANHRGETPIKATRRFSRKPLEVGFPGFSGAGLRCCVTPKYSTGDEPGILCRKRCFLVILDEVNLTAASRETMKCGDLDCIPKVRHAESGKMGGTYRP